MLLSQWGNLSMTIMLLLFGFARVVFGTRARQDTGNHVWAFGFWGADLGFFAAVAPIGMLVLFAVVFGSFGRPAALDSGLDS